MALKDKLVSEGMKLAANPNVAKLMQDERFMRLFMTAMSVPGRVSSFTAEQKETFARAMGLATPRSRVVHRAPDLAGAAEEIGYPLLVKANIGGSGAGIMRFDSAAELKAVVAAGEALMLARRGGLDLAQAFHAIKASSGNSFVHETESQLILNGSYDIDFTMDLACKDLGFAMKFGREFGVPPSEYRAAG